MNGNYVPERMHRGQKLHGEVNIGNRMHSSRSSSDGSSSNTDDKCVKVY